MESLLIFLLDLNGTFLNIGREMHAGKILIVEDNPGQQLFITHLLENDGYIITTANNGAEAFARLTEFPNDLPDVIITDLRMPEIDGIELTRLIRKNYPDIFVIVITGGMDETSLTESFQAGAVDYISKPIKKTELLARIKNSIKLKRTEEVLKKAVKKLRRNNKRLRVLSITDSLTGVYNRRYFFDKLDMIIYESKRYSKPFCLCSLDIDLFKHINDEYGHPSGDEVLLKISDFMRKNIRKADLIARTGGDEFSLIFPHTELEESLFIMDKLKSSIGELEFNFDKLKKISISCGVCEYNKDYSMNEFIFKTDQLLYSAKQKGRNIIEY